MVDAITCLRLVGETYPGPVDFIAFHFPTPYKQGLVGLGPCEAEYVELRGNSQLPSSFTDFMVTSELLASCLCLLAKASGVKGRSRVNFPAGLFMQVPHSYLFAFSSFTEVTSGHLTTFAGCWLCTEQC
jgi:hypothetical protein